MLGGGTRQGVQALCCYRPWLRRILLSLPSRSSGGLGLSFVISFIPSNMIDFENAVDSIKINELKKLFLDVTRTSFTVWLRCDWENIYFQNLEIL